MCINQLIIIENGRVSNIKLSNNNIETLATDKNKSQDKENRSNVKRANNLRWPKKNGGQLHALFLAKIT